MFTLAPAHEIDRRALARWCATTLACACALLGLLRVAVRGYLPSLALAVVLPAVFLALVASVFQTGVALGPLATDEVGRARPLHRRHGFWVTALGTAIALPTLGAFGLVDPWETHYAEVAREMIERHDFISPWWANEGWFMSKPVLTFWLEAISMLGLGVDTGPNAILTGGGGAIARPEWAVRLPGFLLAVVGAYVLYNGVSRTCGRRPAFIGAIVLWTMPGYALLSHQALTDMPLVGGVAASLGLLLRALTTSDAVVVRGYAIRLFGRTVTLHAGHAAALALFAVTLPQLLAIASLHLHLTSTGIHVGADRLVAGSPHACGLPSQPACTPVALAHRQLTPMLEVTLWTPLTLFIAARMAKEKRAARLFALAGWGFASLAAMAKGPAGLAIPAATAIVYALALRSPRVLWRLEIPLGLALAVAMIGPWYLAMYARHGRLFLDELVLRHMFGRTLDHLHDTNDGDDVGITYFIRQLGYATFPWSGAALAAILGSARDDGRSQRDHARAVFFGAALVSFALVSAMRTKFHHYVLVALPPIAMMAGTWIDERLSADARGARRAASAVAIAISAACIVALISREVAGAPAHFVELLSYRYTRAWPSTAAFATVFAAIGALAAPLTLGLAWRRTRLVSAATLGVLAIGSAAALLDLYLTRCASDGGQRAVIAAYYTDRDRGHGPLVAYQLNWKGENFYSGNDLAIFISSGPTMRTYLDTRRRDGDRIVYFVTERGRVPSLRAELGTVRAFAELTDAAVSHEFTLVRAEL